MIKTYPINEEMAGLVPMALEVEQIALTEDIKQNGLREPIVLWRGEIVDGRCRQKACVAVGQSIHVKELDSNLSKEDVRGIVKSLNTRRNLTTTQKVISACKQTLNPNHTLSIENTAKSWGISKRLLDNARYISKHRPEIIEPLFGGESVAIVDKHGRHIDSNKVSAVYAWAKRWNESNQGLNIQEQDYGFKINSYVKTQHGKEWLSEAIELADAKNNPVVTMYLMDLANLKFSMPVDDVVEETKVVVVNSYKSKQDEDYAKNIEMIKQLKTEKAVKIWKDGLSRNSYLTQASRDSILKLDKIILNPTITKVESKPTGYCTCARDDCPECI